MNRQEIYNQIMDDKFVGHVRDFGESHSKSCWGLGYMVWEAITHLKKLKGAIVRNEVVGWSTEFKDGIMSMCDGDIVFCVAQDAGVSFSRLMDFYYVVSFFDRKTVDKYADILPFSYFEYAMTAGSKDKAISILERAEHERHRRGGKNCGLEWLKMQFVNVAGDNTVVDDNNAVIEFDDAANQYYDENDFVIVTSDTEETGQSGPLRAPIWYLITGAENIINRIEKNIADIQMDQKTKSLILEWISSFAEITKLLKQEFGEVESE